MQSQIHIMLPGLKPRLIPGLPEEASGVVAIPDLIILIRVIPVYLIQIRGIRTRLIQTQALREQPIIQAAVIHIAIFITVITVFLMTAITEAMMDGLTILMTLTVINCKAVRK